MENHRTFLAVRMAEAPEELLRRFSHYAANRDEVFAKKMHLKFRQFITWFVRGYESIAAIDRALEFGFVEKLPGLSFFQRELMAGYLLAHPREWQRSLALQWSKAFGRRDLEYLERFVLSWVEWALLECDDRQCLTLTLVDLLKQDFPSMRRHVMLGRLRDTLWAGLLLAQPNAFVQVIDDRAKEAERRGNAREFFADLESWRDSYTGVRSFDACWATVDPHIARLESDLGLR